MNEHIIGAKKGRKISLVIEDDGGANFKFYLDGDIDRLGKVPIGKYTAAEYWATQFLALCRDFMAQTGQVRLEHESPTPPPPLKGA